jgi:hypothetical protein
VPAECPDGGPGVFIYNGKQPLCGLQPFGFEAAEQVEELLDLKPAVTEAACSARRRSPTGVEPPEKGARGRACSYNGKQPLCGLQPFGFEAAEQVEELLDPDHGDLIRGSRIRSGRA